MFARALLGDVCANVSNISNATIYGQARNVFQSVTIEHPLPLPTLSPGLESTGYQRGEWTTEVKTLRYKSETRNGEGIKE